MFVIFLTIYHGFKQDLKAFWIFLGISILLILAQVVFRILKSKKKVDSQRKDFFKTLISPKYLGWQQEIFNRLYANLEFAELYKKKYPALVLRDSKINKYPFGDLCELKSEKLPTIKLSSEQKKFLKILNPTLHYPKMKGFSLKRLHLNRLGFVDKLEANTTNYKQNLVTCHILEWELYKYYKTQKKIPDSTKEILDNLPFRSKYHGDKNAKSAVLEPSDNSFPLLSVQAIIVYRDYNEYNNSTWKVILKKRNTNVAVKPGFFQFPPAGGFEVYGSEDDDDNILLKQGFDVRSAIFREYAEEIFDIKDMQARPDSREIDFVYKEENVVELMNSINTKNSHLDFLGVIVDLSVLRHEISFLLLIDDEDFSKKTIRGNWEAQNIMPVDVRNLKSTLQNENLHSSSAALLQLASENKRLKELGITKSLEL
ncbi:hypothetical protein [Flagellimonas allohymeniacidonis]|uniref:Uncharacterized protein n=1 Tax=Flagellimonas allohymeniacidonis TaxID=2517819 RepID=A0A4Q8QDK5_9FLAO|nr:hypothetical protein [Allomuricauda hymeniacidonis]TAI47794.1 hypothetical protein EW142_14140 [Allomuricauda hymeniacidonis]